MSPLHKKRIGLTWNGTTESYTREIKTSGVNGDREKYFPHSADNKQKQGLATTHPVDAESYNYILQSV